MNEIFCHECGHSINEHINVRSHTSICDAMVTTPQGFHEMCLCTETPQSIAEHAIAEALRTADDQPPAAAPAFGPQDCWVCGGSGIICADGIAINCSQCNPVQDAEPDTAADLMALAEPVLARDWDRPEEDAAWKYLSEPDTTADAVDANDLMDTVRREYGEGPYLCGVNFIVTRSWADQHLNSDDDLKYFPGKAVIK